MSRSTRSTRSATAAARTADSRRQQMKRSLKYFSFQYQRDDVSHERNASYVAITDRQNGTPITMSLQEARSLYNFLETALG